MLALAAALLSARGAGAADWYTGARQQTPSDNWIVAVDSWVTATTTGSTFANMAGTFALTGSARDSGARVRIEGRGGTYHYNLSSGQKISGQQEDASIMLGYEYLWPRGSLIGYIGGNIQNNTLSPNDPNNPVQGTGWGFKVAGELYSNPTPNTLVAASGTYSTLHESYYGRMRVGYDILDRVFVGPEIALLGDDFYRQWRVGAFFTGGRAGPFEFGVSGGFVQDAVQGSGAYGTLDLRLSF
jgi:hypothetical protein